MRVIVAAAGSQAKWGGHLGVRSHFAPVRPRLGSRAREPLLARTLRQVADRSDDVWLVGPADEPEPYSRLAETWGARFRVASTVARNEFESTREVWAPRGDHVLLLGDVWFTADALDTVFARAAEGLRFFGRQGPSAVTGSPWGEIFAQSWTDTSEMTRLTDRVRALQDADRADPSKHGWTMLRIAQETPLRTHVVLKPWWVEIDDVTDDFDFPADYGRHPAACEEAARCV